MGSMQGDRQQTVRNSTGTALDYNSDWSALFDQAGIAAGDWNGRMLKWINQQLSTSYTEINGAMYAFAVANGALNWSGMGTFIAGATILLSGTSQAENTSTNTTIGTLSVVGGSGSYTFTEFADPDNVFTVTGTSLKNSAVFNYEVATFHLVTIQADNSVDTPVTRQFTILVTDVNEAPVITSNGGGGTAAISVAENTTAVTTVTATDADAGATLVYSISGGADVAKFQIGSSSGVLTFISAPDFETPTDTNTDNDYVVIVQVSDGTLTDTQTITVTVTDVGEGGGTIGTSMGLLLTLTYPS